MKRKAIEIDDYEEEDLGDHPITQNCDQIRRKIRSFLNSGEMKVTEFQKTIGVNSNSYGRFMGYMGPYTGSDNGTYSSAYQFFKNREAQGIKAPKKKVKKDVQEKELDVSGIRLEGEGENSVPVFDSCDEIRRKINAYLREHTVTQAAFLREIARTYSDNRKIQSKTLNDFLSKKGASAGNTSAPYYASYVFFEKIRLRDGKEKSKHRHGMESRHPRGFDTERRHDRFLCMVGDVSVEDQYGCVSYIR